MGVERAQPNPEKKRQGAPESNRLHPSLHAALWRGHCGHRGTTITLFVFFKMLIYYTYIKNEAVAIFCHVVRTRKKKKKKFICQLVRIIRALWVSTTGNAAKEQGRAAGETTRVLAYELRRGFCTPRKGGRSGCYSGAIRCPGEARKKENKTATDRKARTRRRDGVMISKSKSKSISIFPEIVFSLSFQYSFISKCMLCIFLHLPDELFCIIISRKDKLMLDLLLHRFMFYWRYD